MKKSVLILAIILVLTFMLTMTASAKKPEPVEGYVPLWSWSVGEYEEYDICDETLVGHVVQPKAPPGKAIHGTFTSGNNPNPLGDPCKFTTTDEGTCELMLIAVEEPMVPESEEGFGIVGRCTDDLEGLHGRMVVHFDFTYDAWYHWDHRP